MLFIVGGFVRLSGIIINILTAKKGAKAIPSRSLKIAFDNFRLDFSQIL